MIVELLRDSDFAEMRKDGGEIEDVEESEVSDRFMSVTNFKIITNSGPLSTPPTCEEKCV